MGFMICAGRTEAYRCGMWGLTGALRKRAFWTSRTLISTARCDEAGPAGTQRVSASTAKYPPGGAWLGIRHARWYRYGFAGSAASAALTSYELPMPCLVLRMGASGLLTSMRPGCSLLPAAPYSGFLAEAPDPLNWARCKISNAFLLGLKSPTCRHMNCAATRIMRTPYHKDHKTGCKFYPGERIGGRTLVQRAWLHPEGNPIAS